MGFGFKNPGFGNILQGISAAAGDLGNPGQNNLADVLKNMQAQKLAEAEEQQKRAQTAQMQDAFIALQGNPNATRADWAKTLLPFFAQQGNVSAAMGFAPDEPKEPTYQQGKGGGWWKLGGAGPPELVVPPEAPSPFEGAPSGYRWNDAHTGYQIDGGYAEGQARIAGLRRDAIVSRPLPQRARAGGGGRSSGGGGGYTGLPPGYSPRAR